MLGISLWLLYVVNLAFWTVPGSSETTLPDLPGLPGLPGLSGPNSSGCPRGCPGGSGGSFTGPGKLNPGIGFMMSYPLVKVGINMKNHPFSMGKLKKNMAVFNSYVSLLQGME